MNYFDVAFPKSPPTWYSKYEVTYESSAFRLLCFRYVKNKESTLVVPPQAGHASTIADYDDGKSLVQTTLACTDGSVYCIDWKSATYERKDETIEDLIDQLRDAFLLIDDSEAHLIGLCQGGWLSAVYAALYPEDVLSLLPIAAPIDFHAGGGVIYETITKYGMTPYRQTVFLCGGLMPGSLMLAGWKMMHPIERFLGDYLDIYKDVQDENISKLEATKRFRTWYEWTQDLAGAWYLEACEKLFLNNDLVNNRLHLKGQLVDLSRINCRVAMIAGEDDDITLRSHLFALKDYVSSQATMSIIIPSCGHIGCFMGRASQRHISQAIQWTRRSDGKGGSI